MSICFYRYEILRTILQSLKGIIDFDWDESGKVVGGVVRLVIFPLFPEESYKVTFMEKRDVWEFVVLSVLWETEEFNRGR